MWRKKLSTETIFKKFAREITGIQQQKSNHQRLAKQSFEHTNRTIEKIKQSEGKIDDFSSSENMSFINVDGQRKFYGHSTQTFEDLKENQIHLYKLQLQWLLVNAYEYFEIYLKSLYASCWKSDDIWKLKHFGSLSLQESKKLALDQVHELAFKLDSKEILNIFRKKIPGISTLETENKWNVNLRFFINVIEKLRHIIVHNNGYIKNMEKFQEKVFKDLGYALNSEKVEELKGTVSLLVDKNDFVDLRKLLGSESILPLEYCRFSILIKKMMCYADLLRMKIGEHVEQNGR